MANKQRLVWDEDVKRRIIALAVGHHTDNLPLDAIINVVLHQAPTVNAVEIPDCEKCAFNYTIAWHQCENCLGQARNNFVSISEVNHEAEP